ncbi:cell wall-binding repeat-containing protein [Desulfitobacterium metallireducens]|uniref:N-acetylmuramoyl-L-alanine amidase n=1 Tax=Desulfitobacterium metallireducens DSM 15288 TaxID=871968 RepID=W0EG90_9FIRM|nr:cell wall-binding repeat-containing protein [Desulfitobacterium metallireducens]AHF08086.1 N-acetylmuramoyl-L-alanine amidase [Desulfitobacterium metallireducens DSM 15288]
MWQRLVKGSALLFLGLVFWLGVQNPVSASPLTADTTRIYGSDRIETAIKISQNGWTGASTVLLARADNFPDSLVSVPLSKRLDAPILLTYPEQMDSNVLQEIQRLGANHVILLGGEGVMGAPITNALDQAGIQWERIGGQDRYETAALVAERLGGNGQAILANGDTFPDALAIGPYAGATETPILLTQASQLPQSTQTELKKLAATETLVVGGEGAVSSNITQGLTGVQRLYGKDRYETASRVYWFSQENLSKTPTSGIPKAYLVTGEDFPDALVAGALAAKQNTPLFMAQKDSLSGVTYSAMINATGGDRLWVILVGGTGVLSTQVQEMVAGTILPPTLLAGKTIIVDPGHGGPDTGAIGPSGTYEKNNTLPVGLDLADLLRSSGANVILTRSSDVSPAGGDYTEINDLKARVNMANQNKADLYVSIHNDSFSNPDAGGTTTYYSVDSPVASQSSALGADIQQEVVKKLGLYNRNVKSANFYVIKNTSMPAVLVELGFISNPTEEKLLSSADFQKKAAEGIYSGILAYQGY